MVFVPTDDQKKTIKFAETVLEQYRKFNRKRPLLPYPGSPQITGMPGGGHNGNPQEDKFIAYAGNPYTGYCDMVKEIIRLISERDSQLQGDILTELYVRHESKPKIQMNHYLGHHPYYDNLNHAKLAFGQYIDKDTYLMLLDEIKKEEIGQH